MQAALPNGAPRREEVASSFRFIWRIHADTGGTFTDCLGQSPEGEVFRCKVLSNACLRYEARSLPADALHLRLEGPETFPDGFLVGCQVRRPGGQNVARVVAQHGREIQLQSLSTELPEDFLRERLLVEFDPGLEAPVLGAHWLMGVPLDQSLPKVEFRLATTRGTNALLEGKGARVAFFVTEGFRDLLRIGDQTRPDLFDLAIARPAPLHHSVVEVTGRLTADGREYLPLELDKLRSKAHRALDQGCEIACIGLLHSDQNPSHEQDVAAFLRAQGFAHVVVSSEVSPLTHYQRRSETALVDAYLAPIMERYLNAVERSLSEGSRLALMTSAGGLVPRHRFRSKDCLLSGPAGGVIGAMYSGRQVGWERLIAFDMGGTSTDVSRCGSEAVYQHEHRVGHARLQAPALRIETVAAGGGSICRVDQGALRVGPESAGASPGPACYGFGGPLTLTDVHVLLGRLSPDRFAIPIQREAAERRFDEMCAGHQLDSATPERYLEGFLQVANERMADAIRVISLREGHDPAQHALLAFGGAGGLHACALADLLGIRRILFPVDAGLLSARGLREATYEEVAERQILKTWDQFEPESASLAEELAGEALQALGEDRIKGPLEWVDTLELRLQGQESTLQVSWNDEDVPVGFEASYRSLFGHYPKGRMIEVVAARRRVKVSVPEGEREDFTQTSPVKGGATQRAWIENGWLDIPKIVQSDWHNGQHVAGPFLLLDDYSTLFVERGWKAVKGSLGSLRLEKASIADRSKDSVEDPPELILELFTQRFRGLVDLMGVQLRKTALSTNVKERLDYSCCLLDAQGRLAVNAPHIPVHLGAMGLCVRRVAEVLPLAEGDVVVTNHPAFGGSHLPDITVISPIFVEGECVAYLANRAHHAEIGGKSPGSMSPLAGSLEEEGVIIPPCYWLRGGEFCGEELRHRLQNAPFPSRAVDDNLADLQAQVAANLEGKKWFLELIAQHTTPVVLKQLKEILKQSASAVETFILTLPEEPKRIKVALDDGSQIIVKRIRQGNRLTLDFTGTTEHHPSNLHATPAIVNSAVIYVLRVLLKQDLPLNEGFLEPVDLILPRCFLNPDFEATPAPAVAGGNVETSQRLVDALLGLFEVVAESQGTMNNLIFGNEGVSYYETIGGGTGAGPNFAGASGVHSHMTNTAITDPEILERRYPVRLWQFALRQGSGGEGQNPGGNGLIREIEFLEPLTLSLLTQHRISGPLGMAGGGDGKAGSQRLTRSNGAVEELSSLVACEVQPGDRLIIETPGGGGWGMGEKS